MAGVRWVDMDIFDESNVQWDLIQRQNYQGGTYLFPSIDLPKEGDVTKTDHLNFYLWGLTYGVTSDLITLMGKQELTKSRIDGQAMIKRPKEGWAESAKLWSRPRCC